MSGQLLVGEPDAAADEPHLRVRFTFTDGGPELRFVDQRTFGGLSLVARRRRRAARRPIAHIARDPLDPAFDDDAAFVAGAARRGAPGSSGRCSTRRWSRGRQHLRRRGAVAGPAARGPADRRR